MSTRTKTIVGTTFTPPEIGERYGVSPEKVLGWIKRDELRAINVASTLGGRPRYVIFEADLLAFEQRRATHQDRVPPRRRKQLSGVTNYF